MKSVIQGLLAIIFLVGILACFAKLTIAIFDWSFQSDCKHAYSQIPDEFKKLCEVKK